MSTVINRNTIDSAIACQLARSLVGGGINLTDGRHRDSERIATALGGRTIR